MLLKKVKKTIENYRMLKKGERVVVGFSGGPDSTCLLWLLFRLRKDLALSLYAAYLNHGIRKEEVKEEESRVKEFTSKLGIPLTIEKVDLPSLAKEGKGSLEEVARKVRYTFLEGEARRRGAEKIAVGHTASDQVETLLMRFLRGGGRGGLSGIPPVRGKIIRPLIEIFREEIEDYLKKENISPFYDSSNRDLSFLRNRIRLELIPYLKKQFGPQVEKVLFRIGKILREEDEYLEERAEEVFHKIVKREKEGVYLRGEELKSIPLALQRRVVRKAVDKLRTPGREIEFDHIGRILEFVEKKRGKILELPGGIKLWREREGIFFSEKEEKVSFCESLPLPGKLKLPQVGLEIETELILSPPLSFNSEEGYFDWDKIKFPLRVRNRREGDRFIPLGMRKEKKLKEFFIDLKIPRRIRDRIPLVVSGDDIIWVVGIRADERFRVEKRTKRILKIKVRKIKNGEKRG